MGVIIAQSPSGDSKVSKGTTIDLVVNKAKAKKDSNAKCHWYDFKRCTRYIE